MTVYCKKSPTYNVDLFTDDFQHPITILNIILNARQQYFHIQIVREQLENKQTFRNIDVAVHAIQSSAQTRLMSYCWCVEYFRRQDISRRVIDHAKNQVLAFFCGEKGEFPEPASFHCQYIWWTNKYWNMSLDINWTGKGLVYFLLMRWQVFCAVCATVLLSEVVRPTLRAGQTIKGTRQGYCLECCPYGLCHGLTRHRLSSTHWGRDEMNNISQTTFSNVFFQWKCLNFD